MIEGQWLNCTCPMVQWLQLKKLQGLEGLQTLFKSCLPAKPWNAFSNTGHINVDFQQYISTVFLSLWHYGFRTETRLWTVGLAQEQETEMVMSAAHAP